MIAYLVQGTHPSVPGLRSKLTLDLADANATAASMLDDIAKDIDYDDAGGPTSPADWRQRLAAMQLFRIADASGEDTLEIEREANASLDPATYLETDAEFAVWIDEHAIDLGVPIHDTVINETVAFPAARYSEPMANPVTLATMEAYRALAMAVVELEENRPSVDGPDALGTVLDSLAGLYGLAERCLNLDPPSDSKPQAAPVSPTN